MGRLIGNILTQSSGKTLTIEAIGTFKEDIGKGAYVVLQVKYGLIKLLSTTADLCEQIKEVDMECPIKAGETKITKEVELPAQIPPVCCVPCLLVVVDWLGGRLDG
jgi:hypothetical protein